MGRRILLLALAAWALGVSCACAQWRVASSQSERGAAEVEHRRVTLESAAGERANLHLAIFSPKKATLRVIDAAETSSSLAEVMRRENGIAGVNGGYFSPEHEPIGLLISGGKVIEPLRKAKLLSGVLSVADGNVRIQRRGAYLPKSRPSAARQSGPFLVERGRAVPGLNSTRGARRTFAATLSDGRAALGYGSSLTLAELAQILATAEIVSGEKVQDALNLDGGSSSAFWFAGKNGVFSRPESKTVRDFIAIVPRK